MNQRYTQFKHIKVTAPADVTSGSPVRVGCVAGVAKFDALSGEPVTIWLDGSYTIEVAGALTEGQVVYITSAGALTATAGTNHPWGVAVLAKAAGTSDAEVAPFGNNPAVAVAAGA